MTTTPTIRYKDTWQEFSSIQEMAWARVTTPGPNLGGSLCPAYEFTFGVSEDNGATWRNPTPLEKDQLAQAIIQTGRCCQNDIESCPVKKHTPE